jgi:hypothetical protein
MPQPFHLSKVTAQAAEAAAAAAAVCAPRMRLLAP